MNLAWSIVWNLSEGFQKARDKLNTVSEVLKKTPDVLVCKVSWYIVNKTPELKVTNFRLYIWQIFNNWRWLYDEEFIIWAIKTYLEHLEKWEKLVIESAWIVSWIVNWLQKKDWALSSDEQVRYLEKIVSTYFPKEKERIQINKIEDRHNDLLSTIKENWLDWLKSIDLDKDFSSLYIVWLLYKASQKSNKFFTRILSTIKKTNWEREDFKNYYALIEIAIRLTDYFNWIYIHGWEERQSLYDSIITDILNWKFDYIEELKVLKEMWDITKLPFSTLNFSKDKYKKEKERQEKEKSLTRKVRNTIWWVTLSVASALWGINYGINSYKDLQEYELDERINTQLINALENKSIYIFFKPSIHEEIKTDAEKLDYLQKTWDTLVDLFTARYWEWKVNKKELKLFFVVRMVEILQFPHITDSSWEKSYIEFIEIVLQNPIWRTELISMWFEVDNNYWKYEWLKKSFETTYKYNWNYKISWDKLNIWVMNYVGSNWNSYEIQNYTCDFKPMIGSVNCPAWIDINQSYILARIWDYSDFTTEDWKKVALDFLSSPYNLLIKQIISIWPMFWNVLYTLENEVRKKLVELVLEKRFTPEQIKSWWSKEIIVFLQKNFKEHLRVDFEEIAKNTLNLDEKTIKEFSEQKDKLFADRVWKIKIEYAKNFQVDHMLVVFEYKWKKYFYLDSTNYSYWEWLRLYWFTNINDTKKFSDELLKLL